MRLCYYSCQIWNGTKTIYLYSILKEIKDQYYYKNKISRTKIFDKLRTSFATNANLKNIFSNLKDKRSNYHQHKKGNKKKNPLTPKTLMLIIFLDFYIIYPLC